MREIESLTLKGIDRAPEDVLPGTGARKEKTLSPAVRSPFVPSSNRVCAADPPIEDKSALTVISVLAGFVPGVTVTVNSVDVPVGTDAGVTVPVDVSAVSTTVMLFMITRCSRWAVPLE